MTEKELLCRIQEVTIPSGSDEILKEVNLDFERGTVVAVIDRQQNGGRLLQAIAGMRSIKSGQIVLADGLHKIQYVPDDIICYDSLEVGQFLKGFSINCKNVDLEKGLKLCQLFGIEEREQLLNLTFEQNRLVAMIQALMAEPQILLLDNPHNMISDETYALLTKEFETLKTNGTVILIASASFEQIGVACDTYHFMKDGMLYKSYKNDELPKPAKVLMVRGGDATAFADGMFELLWEQDEKRCYLSEEKAVSLAKKLQASNCVDFMVEQLSMDEVVYEEFERWHS